MAADWRCRQRAGGWRTAPPRCRSDEYRRCSVGGKDPPRAESRPAGVWYLGRDRCFYDLGFCSLPVIPKLRRNTYGIVDAERQQILPRRCSEKRRRPGGWFCDCFLETLGFPPPLLKRCSGCFWVPVCGGLIGLERELKGRPAGLKTFSLVCMGSALVMVTNEYLRCGMIIRVMLPAWLHRSSAGSAFWERAPL